MIQVLGTNLFNTLLFLVWGVLDLLLLLAVFRLFGRAGLIGLIAASVVLMNILVTKSVMIFGVGATGGNVPADRRGGIKDQLERRLVLSGDNPQVTP